jgi:hypothetical protein
MIDLENDCRNELLFEFCSHTFRKAPCKFQESCNDIANVALSGYAVSLEAQI